MESNNSPDHIESTVLQPRNENFFADQHKSEEQKISIAVPEQQHLIISELETEHHAVTENKCHQEIPNLQLSPQTHTIQQVQQHNAHHSANCMDYEKQDLFQQPVKEVLHATVMPQSSLTRDVSTTDLQKLTVDNLTRIVLPPPSYREAVTGMPYSNAEESTSVTCTVATTYPSCSSATEPLLCSPTRNMVILIPSTSTAIVSSQVNQFKQQIHPCNVTNNGTVHQRDGIQSITGTTFATLNNSISHASCSNRIPISSSSEIQVMTNTNISTAEMNSNNLSVSCSSSLDVTLTNGLTSAAPCQTNNCGGTAAHTIECSPSSSSVQPLHSSGAAQNLIPDVHILGMAGQVIVSNSTSKSIPSTSLHEVLVDGSQVMLMGDKQLELCSGQMVEIETEMKGETNIGQVDGAVMHAEPNMMLDDAAIVQDNAHIIQVDSERVYVDVEMVQVDSEMVHIDVDGNDEVHSGEMTEVHAGVGLQRVEEEEEETIFGLEEHEVADGDGEEESNSVRHSILCALLDEGEEDEQAHQQEQDYDESCNNLHMESCIDSVWSEEILLQLIALHGNKEGWQDCSNHTHLYQELLSELSLGTDVTWQHVQQKWSQLYTIYTRVLNQCQDGTLSPPSSALFLQLQMAEEHQLTVNDGTDISSTETPNSADTLNSVDGGTAVAASNKNTDRELSIYKCRRRSPEFVWSMDITRRFIRARADKHVEISAKGHAAVYREVLEELGLSDRVTVMMARKKWNYLVNRYQDECAAGGDRSWSMIDEMSRVMARFAGLDTSKLKSRASPEFLWPNELTVKFIDLRVAKQDDFVKKGIQYTYNSMLHELGLAEILTSNHLRKKWNYLVAKHKEVSSSTGSDGSCPGPHVWPFYDRMTNALTALALVGGKASEVAKPLEHVWSRSVVLRFIQLRAARAAKIKNVTQLYAVVLADMGLSHVLKPNQARKKWNYLWGKYQELSQAGVSEYLRSTWPYYKAMRAVASEMLLAGAGYHADSRSSVSPPPVEGASSADQYAPADSSSPVTSHIPCSSTFVIGSTNSNKKKHMYTCFLCGITSAQLAEYYMFEHEQRLLHTQNTVLDLLGHLLGRKMQSVEATSVFCTRCTLILNEADSVINRHDKLKHEARELYELRLRQNKEAAVKEELSGGVAGGTPKLGGQHEGYGEANLTVGRCSIDSVTSPAVEIVVKSAENFSIGEDTVEISNNYDDDDDDEGDGVGGVRLKSSVITYSKRGRKRKSTVFSEAIQKCMKLESGGDGGLDSYECEVELQDDVQYAKHSKRKPGSGRGGRGRGRGVRRGRGRGRGRPVVRSTLIGRGLEGQYPTNNKRGSMIFNGPKIYTCTECHEEFKKYTDLVAHRKEKHIIVDNTPLEVEETVLESGVITYFNKDKANSTDTSHPCKVCGKIFLRKDDLSYHFEISHTDGKGRSKSAFKDKSYVCEECGDSFLFKYKLKLHINSKHLNDAGESANDFTCGDCGSKLGSLPGLTFHMRKHHDKVLNYKKNSEYLCSDCGFLATSSKKLQEHQGAHCGHTAKEQVQCEICGKTVLKVSLKMHRIKMHSEFKEQCDRCGERYATKTDLLRHINVIHLKILLYMCKQCGEKFATSDALRYHRIKEHEKAAFFCHACHKGYKRIGELNTHMKRVHAERRKAEVCTYCNKTYFDRSGLRNHLVSKHNVPQELTYSDTYLRKKRVDGLPLAKHLERRVVTGEESKHEMEIITTHQLQEMMQGNAVAEESHHHHHQHQQPHHVAISHQQQHILTSAVEGSNNNHGTLHQHQHHLTTIHQHPHHHHQQHHQQQVLVDEAAVAARALAAYNDGGGGGVPEDDSSLVVTEITENTPEHQQQAIIIDPLGNIIHHPMQVAAQQTVAHLQHHPHHQQQHQQHAIVTHHPSHQLHQQQHHVTTSIVTTGAHHATHHTVPLSRHGGVVYQMTGQHAEASAGQHMTLQ